MSDQPTVESASVSEAPKAAKKGSPLFVIIIVVIVLLGLAGGTAAMAYDIFVRRSDDGVARALANALPIPAAKVGSRTILYRSFLSDRDVVKKFIASPAAAAQNMSAPFDAKMEQSVYDKLLAEAVVDELADQQKLTVSDDEVQKYYDEVVTAASSTTPDMSAYLRDNFGWTEQDFRARVLKPAILQDKLGQKMMDDAQGDQSALATAVEKRLAEKDVVKYLKF